MKLCSSDDHYRLFIGYLSINSLRNKLIDLREIMSKVSLDIACIDETKLDESFPDSQFHIENYQFPRFGEIEIEKLLVDQFFKKMAPLLKESKT